MKRIGILGFGIVGTAVARFIAARERDVARLLFDAVVPLVVSVWDKKNLTEHEHSLLIEYHAQHLATMNIQEFIDAHDIIIASPGFDINKFTHQQHKFRNELDLFVPFFTKTTLGITGTLGKTSTTTLLTNMLNHVAIDGHTLRFFEGGNVGTAMLDLVARQKDCDGAVLELSSWQLEHNKTWAPDIAVWTTFYPNHLDRHKTMAAYAHAKYQLMQRQHAGQYAIMSDQVLCDHDVRLMLPTLQSRACVVTEMMRDEIIPMLMWQSCDIIDICNGVIRFSRIEKQCVVEEIMLADLAVIPRTTFLQNWLFIVAVLKRLHVDMHIMQEAFTSQAAGVEHRLEWCAAVQGVDFYNDSKSTVIQSTQAAIKKLAYEGRPLRVIVGGLGKGVDRSTLAALLQEIPAIKKAYCFGPACEEFASCERFASLEQLLEQVFIDMQAGDVVLFSPSGSSYDFFDNYEHRGRVFKELVQRKGGSVD